MPNLEKNIVIGIEGLVGAGKTSICRKLLDYIVSITPPNTKITLDSSLSSKDFYIKYGFIQKSDVLQMNEMKYIEMEYQI